MTVYLYLYLYLFIYFPYKTTKQDNNYTEHALIQNNEIRLDSPYSAVPIHDTAVHTEGSTKT